MSVITITKYSTVLPLFENDDKWLQNDDKQLSKKSPQHLCIYLQKYYYTYANKIQRKTEENGDKVAEY
jgi:hypothetical protein